MKESKAADARVVDITSNLTKAQRVDEISSELSKTIGWEDIRGKHGENVMHIMAQYRSNLFHKHLLSIDRVSCQSSRATPRTVEYAKSCIELMKAPDDKGRYPLEYFLCFAGAFDIYGSPINEDTVQLIERQGIPKPDWLETKLLIVENRVAPSAVDSALMSIWKQKTPDDFKKCLKSDRGQKLLSEAVGIGLNFMYTKNTADNMKCDDIYYGMNIIKYIHPEQNGDTIGAFLSYVKTKPEVKLCLDQAFHYLFVFRHADSMFDEKTTNSLMDRAIEMGLAVEINEIKNRIIKSFGSDKPTADVFNETMSKYFKKWNILDVMAEKGKLLGAINSTNYIPNERQSRPQISSAL